MIEGKFSVLADGFKYQDDEFLRRFWMSVLALNGLCSSM